MVEDVTEDCSLQFHMIVNRGRYAVIQIISAGGVKMNQTSKKSLFKLPVILTVNFLINSDKLDFKTESFQSDSSK